MADYNYLDFWELDDLEEEDRTTAEECGCEEGVLYHGPVAEALTATICPFCGAVLEVGSPCDHCAFVYDYNYGGYIDFDEDLKIYLIKKLKEINYSPDSYEEDNVDKDDEIESEELLSSELDNLSPNEDPLEELLKGIVQIEKEENAAGSWIGSVSCRVSGWFSEEKRAELKSL